MSSQNEAHGDEDWKDAIEPTARHLELALENVVECILDHGGYPAQGRRKFDLYDWLFENANRDPSYAFEMYVVSLSSNMGAYEFENIMERERKAVEAVLIKHLKDSELVAVLAAEYAAEDE